MTPGSYRWLCCLVCLVTFGMVKIRMKLRCPVTGETVEVGVL